MIIKIRHDNIGEFKYFEGIFLVYGYLKLVAQAKSYNMYRFNARWYYEGIEPYTKILTRRKIIYGYLIFYKGSVFLY